MAQKIWVKLLAIFFVHVTTSFSCSLRRMYVKLKQYLEYLTDSFLYVASF